MIHVDASVEESLNDDFDCFKTLAHLFDSRKSFINSALRNFSESNFDKMLDSVDLNLYNHSKQVILAYREFQSYGLKYDYKKVREIISKGETTRINQICKWIVKFNKDGYINPCYNLTGTETGRITSKNFPFANLDNKKEIRDLFTLDDDKIYFYFDYSQAEIIIAANLFGDENFLKLIETKKDIYEYFGNQYGLSREVAKKWLISSIYGSSYKSLSHSEGLPHDVSMTFQAMLFFTFPKIRDWIGYTRHSQKEKYIYNDFKRRRNTSGLSEQAIMNFPIQSALADIKSIVIRDLYELDLVKHLRLDFHDGLVFECGKGEFKEVSRKIYDSMVHPKISKYFPDSKLTKIKKMPVKLEISSTLWF